MPISMILITLANVMGIILFLYLLFVVGGIARNAKQILHKLEGIEKRLELK